MVLSRPADFVRTEPKFSVLVLSLVWFGRVLKIILFSVKFDFDCFLKTTLTELK